MKIIDMHCDTISEILKRQRVGESCGLQENNGHLDLKRMEGSGYLLQNFALFVDQKAVADPWEEFCALHRIYCEEMQKNADRIAPVLQFRDIAANQESKKMSALLTVEEGAVCKGELARLRKLYAMGVRMMTLTWNYPNELGYPNLDKAKRGEFSEYFYTPNTSDGLTETGREFVEEMEQMGMIVDVSHLSDAGFYDVLQYTHKPFVASHSNARTVCRCVRNLSDDMIRKLAERGGCMGLNYCPDFLEEPVPGKENTGTIAAVVRHARYITNLGGIEVLGLGSDFDGIDTHRELPGVQSLELLWDALHKAGFTQNQLDAIFYQNVWRVYHDTLR